VSEQAAMADAVGLLLSGDLYWGSKIVETARALGRPVRQARTLEELSALLGALRPCCVILDLCLPQIDADRVARVVRAQAPDARLTAFGRHTDVAGLERARAAGCEPVLVRSALAARLPEELSAWLAG
jgi:DNA-binding NarL/FixJ family response regulator